jgi:hypothetical protein
MADDITQMNPPAVTEIEPVETTPVKKISSEQLKRLGELLTKRFEEYKGDRRLAEDKWVRNLRQYLGLYDPEIERSLGNRSRAYPKITRVKCISVLSRIMNLMFPGNERNWSLQASPHAEMSTEEVEAAVQKAMARAQADGAEQEVTPEFIQDAVQRLADERADAVARLVDDQLQELGGDQTCDYIALNRRVVASGIMYGVGVLTGPCVNIIRKPRWTVGPDMMPVRSDEVRYKPQYEFLPVWDFYPDMAAKSFYNMDGYFRRYVMSKGQVRRLADREDFFGKNIRHYLATEGQTGNYKEQPFESELRSMGSKLNTSEQKFDTGKYEVIVWHGIVSGQMLAACGCDVTGDDLADDIEAEVWMIGNHVVKVQVNPWRKIGVDVRTHHVFSFDEDDTSIIGNGLPSVMRDSQMSIAAATRMLLDNASVVCGPNIELNLDLLRADQDLTAISAYKIWYREGLGADATAPAVRNLTIDSHMGELLQTIELFMKFVDMETFVGPATGGDMEKQKGEPLRTAAGASMLRADAALPFKDIIRNFDSFTQSVIHSLVQFNRVFNKDKAPEGDYNVIARGATSLIAKEIRGVQMDALASTLTPEDKDHVDERKFVEARFAVRDLQDMLLPPDEAKRNKASRNATQAEMMDIQKQLNNANVRKTLADAVKNIAQAQKNLSSADQTAIKAALDILEAEQMGADDGNNGAPAAKKTRGGRR